MLVKTIETADQLKAEFKAFNRDQYDFATYEGLIVYYEENRSPVELDVIAICCDLCEMTITEAAQYYDKSEDEVVEYIQENTSIIAETDDIVSFWGF